MLNRTSIFKIYLILIGMSLTVLHSSWINASDIDKKVLNGLQIHGFLSQGWTKTTDGDKKEKNDFFGDSSGKEGSFAFRELGVNASHRPLTNLQLSMQLLSRQAGEDSKGGIRIDYGFLDYTVLTTETKEFGVRLGRTKNPLLFYNDTRDVPFTRPSIILPQSIYFDRVRNFGLASDGVQLYGESRSEWGDITAQFSAVFPQVGDTSTEVGVLGRKYPGDLKTRLSYIGRIMYERDGGRWRFAVSGAHFNIGYDPDLNDPLSTGSFRFSPLYFSAQYNAERWSLTSEYAIRHIERENFFNRGVPDSNFTGESFYVQGIYRFNPTWEAVLRYDVYYADRKDRDGNEFQAATGRPDHSRFAKDLTVGLRWNITPSIMMRGEYHRVNGTGWLSTLDNPTFQSMTVVQPDNPQPLNPTDQHWNLFAVQVSYRF
ncbi:hypothetical protein SAMN05421863_10974 [Nitrosomonas communis]|uniref:Phosphate-selective porin O and P n=2 Tax=Nitrosomonas communis TaxID=44574 RepID=A0A1I4W2L9_9PROT|nr:hypothetical protein SAMN05421863_10974 [Nitrosomonas communis]